MMDFFCVELLGGFVLLLKLWGGMEIWWDEPRQWPHLTLYLVQDHWVNDGTCGNILPFLVFFFHKFRAHLEEYKLTRHQNSVKKSLGRV